MNISLFPFARENLVLRDGFGRPVPSRASLSLSGNSTVLLYSILKCRGENYRYINNSAHLI